MLKKFQTFPVPCARCGTIVQKDRQAIWKAEKYRQRLYCSARCSQLMQAKERGKRVFTTCAHCLKRFLVKTHRNKRRWYCSRDCAIAHTKRGRALKIKAAYHKKVDRAAVRDELATVISVVAKLARKSSKVGKSVV